MVDKPRQKKVRVLVVDDEADICRMLTMCLEAGGHHVKSVATMQEALVEAAQSSFDLIFLDLRLGTENGLDAIGPLLTSSPWVEVVVITAYAAVETAVEAMKRGASEYLSKPFTPAQVRLVVQKVADAQALKQRAAALAESLASSGPPIDFDTTSGEMREAIEIARRAAEGNATILIQGEPGTGKRTLARAIHAWSPRSDKPLAVAGCLAPSIPYLEADWFGTQKKAAAGKVTEQPGRIAFCDGGTLVVEDVDRLPPPIQPKLLRLLQQGEFERPADFATRAADVRVVATSPADLAAMVAEGKFYPDLHQALNTVSVRLPPLRHRPDDVVLLAERYAAFFARQTRRSRIGLTSTAAEALRRHSWPGNVRELKNLIERAVLVCRGDEIDSFDLPFGSLNRINAVSLGDPVPLGRVEELHIRGVIAASASIEAAASTLGMDTVTLWRRRKQYGI